MHSNINNTSPILELTVISAQGLKKVSVAAFSQRLRSFVTVSASTTRSSKHMRTYKTRVDDKGGVNPTWGDKFYLRLDQTFFYQRYPGIYLQLYTKHLLMGKTHLGWCCIPAGDIVNRLSVVGSTRFLSYGLRDRDGTRGHGVVNVAVRLDCSFGVLRSPRSMVSNFQQLPGMGESDLAVIGIPITGL